MLEPRPEIRTATRALIVVHLQCESSGSAFDESMPVQRLGRRYTGVEEETSAAAAVASAVPRRGAIEHSQSYHAVSHLVGAGRDLGDHGRGNAGSIFPVPSRPPA